MLRCVAMDKGEFAIKYVDPKLWKEASLLTYEYCVQPIPYQNFWYTNGLYEVHPPIIKKKLRRPKAGTRIREPGSLRKHKRGSLNCTKCKAFGSGSKYLFKEKKY